MAYASDLKSEVRKDMRVRLPPWTLFERPTMIHRKCITFGCQNSSDKGAGRTILVDPDDDGWICEPCWNFLINADPSHSQLYQNAHHRYASLNYDRDTDYFDDEFYDALDNYDTFREEAEAEAAVDELEGVPYMEPANNILISEELQKMMSSMRVRPLSFYNEVNQTLIDHHT